MLLRRGDGDHREIITVVQRFRVDLQRRFRAEFRAEVRQKRFLKVLSGRIWIALRSRMFPLRRVDGQKVKRKDEIGIETTRHDVRFELVLLAERKQKDRDGHTDVVQRVARVQGEMFDLENTFLRPA